MSAWAFLRTFLARAQPDLALDEIIQSSTLLLGAKSGKLELILLRKDELKVVVIFFFWEIFYFQLPDNWEFLHELFFVI